MFNDTILRAARGEKTDYTPVWFMRQVGRSQPEYNKIKEQYGGLIEITKNPEITAYLTATPVENYNVDAAILYKDIITPLAPIGIDVDIVKGVGPVIDNPIRRIEDVEALGELDPTKDLDYTVKAIDILVNEKLNVPLIGFCGAPFTVASYMIEGGPTRRYHKTKSLMYNDEKTWFALMEKLTDMSIIYLKAQVDAGAKMIQIFDSWAGALNKEDYEYYLGNSMRRLISETKKLGVPVTIFGIGANHLLKEWDTLGSDVIGLDWRTSIKEAREMGINKSLQGNLDPAILLAEWDVIEKYASQILDQGQNKGHIFNLGHGVFPEVNPDTLKRLTEFVHNYSKGL
ncbi:uroporphyrinogen decarboxylase [Nosocomiicoccus ampullae]|uniref:uroporphyrinogen decarboxylase n=1 Tax=Nosocomiicoccus ampullae TaxID=489910 RepID=UPI002550E4F4|nr:uroporphyrinogen decarboxylase [Nosocomiicoccus ampullae]MDK6863545.1 uroporphyrinogen decarboxylase [Nosocomiicoccus ampullae]